MVGEWVELLVSAGANVDASGPAVPGGSADSTTALMQLCDRPTFKGRKEARLPGVRALVGVGADVTKRTRGGDTALLLLRQNEASYAIVDAEAVVQYLES